MRGTPLAKEMEGRIGRQVRWRGGKGCGKGTDGRRRLMEARIDGRREWRGHLLPIGFLP